SELCTFKNAVYLIIHSDKITQNVHQRLLILREAVVNLLQIKDPELKKISIEILRDVRQILVHDLDKLDDAPFLGVYDHLINAYVMNIVREGMAFERKGVCSKAI